MSDSWDFNSSIVFRNTIPISTWNIYCNVTIATLTVMPVRGQTSLDSRVAFNDLAVFGVLVTSGPGVD